MNFRLDAAKSTFYAFYVTADGKYSLIRGQSTTTTQTLVGLTSSSAIHRGLGQTNTLAVVAQGNTITLYVNRQPVNTVSDGTYSHGQIALIAAANVTSGHPTEVAYNNAKVWVLP
jgi:hypothetical protein